MIKVLPISVCEFLTDSQTKSKIIVQKKKETKGEDFREYFDREMEKVTE